MSGAERLIERSRMMADRPADDMDESVGGMTLRTPVMAGLTAIGIGFGGFFGWAFTARLDNAAVAVGTIIVDSKRKTVSHFEGGILKALLVHEGAAVKAGQPLVRLEDTRARSELQQLAAKRIGLEVRLARLRAEQQSAETISLPEHIRDSDSPIAKEVITAESRLFAARREVDNGKVDINRKVIEQHQAEAAALDAQIEATARQRQLVESELQIIQDLVEKRYAKRTQLVELQTRQSELNGRAGELTARKAKAEQAVAGARLEILSLGTERQREIADDLQTTQLALTEVIEKIRTAKDVLERVELVSPQDGIVTNIRSRTPGGAIAAGEPILDIVPENEPLIVEARIDPRDIDAVHVGSETHVRLTAFNARLLPPLRAKVSYVAADQLVDDKTGAAFFIARAQIDPSSLAESKATLYPGMPAEVLVLNGARRAIDYLVAPIAESFTRAFRED